MGEEEDVLARRERRIGRRDRTKSPNLRRDDDVEEPESMGDASARRKSAVNFSASKLVESLKEANETTITRLKRVASTDGMAKAASDVQASRTRRPLSRTISAQTSRRPERRLRAAETDVLSQSLGDNFGENNNDMDNSNMSGSQTNRRRAPQRTKSSDSGLHRGQNQRAPRARRRPAPADREDSAEDLSGEQNRRRLPLRSKSAQDAFPPRGVARPARPGRRRPQASQNEDDIFISDSDEDNHKDQNDNIDRSSRRRGPPPRTRSAHDGPTRAPQRTSRATRRRPSGDSADASPNRPSGPGLQRSLTSTPPSSSPGPGLARSHTSTNPRGVRSRGGRNTARELAQVASNREKSPDPSDVINDVGDPFAARDAVRSVSSQHHSTSPIKSRQERRRMREGKEREVLERRMQGHGVDKEESLVEPEKKEEPWMRRLKKNVGDRAPDDSCNLGDAAVSTHAEGTKGSSLPRLGENSFAMDPTFGVFPAVSDMPLSTMEPDALNDDDGTAHLSITGGENKLDFSTIS